MSLLPSFANGQAVTVPPGFPILVLWHLLSHKMGEKGWGGWATLSTRLESSNTAPPEAELLGSKHVCSDSEQTRSDLTLVQWRVHQMGGRESYSFGLWSCVLFFSSSKKKSIQEDSILPPPIHSLSQGVGETESGLGYNIIQLGCSLTQLQVIMVKREEDKGTHLHNCLMGKKSNKKTFLKKKNTSSVSVKFSTQAESFQILPGEWKQMES